MASQALIDAYNRGKKARKKAKKRGVVTTQPQKPKPKPKKSNKEAAQEAYQRGVKARSTQQKKGVVTSQPKKQKPTTQPQTIYNFGTYNAKKDAKSAYKKGSGRTGLGTKQEEETVKFNNPLETIVQKQLQKDAYYQSKDWTNAQKELKAQNRQGWRDHLSKDLGWSEDEINEWMKSEEGKEYRRNSYKDLKKTVKDDINKQIDAQVKKENELHSVNALTPAEIQAVEVASRMGPEQGTQYLKALGIDKKVGSKTVASGVKSKFAYGLMQGSGYGDIWQGSVGTYNKEAKRGIKNVQDSGAYMLGYGAGMAGAFGLNKTSAAGRAIAGTAGKNLAKGAGRKQIAKQFAKNRAGELVAETPINVADAIKMATDENGKVDKKEVAKWLGFNTAITVGAGGALEGAGMAFTRKNVNKFVELRTKMKNGTATYEDKKQYTELYDKLKSAMKDEGTGKAAIANNEFSSEYVAKAKADVEKADLARKEEKIDKKIAKAESDLADVDTKNMPKTQKALNNRIETLKEEKAGIREAAEAAEETANKVIKQDDLRAQLDASQKKAAGVQKHLQNARKKGKSKADLEPLEQELKELNDEQIRIKQELGIAPKETKAQLEADLNQINRQLEFDEQDLKDARKSDKFSMTDRSLKEMGVTRKEYNKMTEMQRFELKQKYIHKLDNRVSEARRTAQEISEKIKTAPEKGGIIDNSFPGKAPKERPMTKDITANINKEVKDIRASSSTLKGKGMAAKLRTGMTDIVKALRRGDTDAAREIAEKLARETKKVDTQVDYGSFKGTEASKVSTEIKQYLFTSPVNLSGIKGTIDDFLEREVGMRKADIGNRVKFSKSKGQSIDELYHHLQEIAPERFPEDIYSDGDMLQRILDAAFDAEKSTVRELSEDEIEQAYKQFADDYIEAAYRTLDADEAAALRATSDEQFEALSKMADDEAQLIEQAEKDAQIEDMGLTEPPSEYKDTKEYKTQQKEYIDDVTEKHINAQPEYEKFKKYDEAITDREKLTTEYSQHLEEVDARIDELNKSIKEFNPDKASFYDMMAHEDAKLEREDLLNELLRYNEEMGKRVDENYLAIHKITGDDEAAFLKEREEVREKLTADFKESDEYKAALYDFDTEYQAKMPDISENGYAYINDDITIQGERSKEDLDKVLHAEGKKEHAVTIGKENALEDFKKAQSEGKVGKVAEDTEETTKTLKKGEQKTFKSASRLYRRFVDSFADFEKFSKTLPYEIGHKFRVQINNVRISKQIAKAEGEKVFDIYKSFGITGKKNAEKRADYELYCFLKHDLDRLDNGTEVFYGLTDRQSIINVLDDLETRYGDDLVGEKGFQQQMVKFFSDLLDRETEAGLTGVTRVGDRLVSATELRLKYPNYVPTFRNTEPDFKAIMDDAESAIDVAKGMKKAKGANGDELIPLYNQALAKSNQVLKRTETNKMFRMLADLQGVKPSSIPANVSPEQFMDSCVWTFPDKATGKYHAIYYVDGKAQKLDITESMYKGYREWSGEEKLWFTEFRFTKGMGVVNRAFKAWITDYSVVFGVKNAIRDQATALLYSQNTRAYIKAFPKAIGAILGKNNYYQAYKAGGGVYDQLVTSVKGSRSINELANYNPLKVIEKFNSALEMLPRMQEFIGTVDRIAKRDGRSIDSVLADRNVIAEAIYNSKEVTLNFSRSGIVGKALNRSFVPFFNPAVQGLDKLIKVMVTDNKGKSGRQFMLFGAKAVGMVAMPAVVWESVMANNKDYQNLTDYQKDSNYCIPLSWFGEKLGIEGLDGKFLKIPKAREIGAIQNPIVHFIRNLKYGDLKDLDDWISCFKIGWSQIGPVNPISDNIFSPMWRVSRNQTWYGGQIESADDQKLCEKGESWKVYDENTSALAIWLGKNDKLCRKFNFSPKKIDNMLDSYMGVAYDMGIGLKKQSAVVPNSGAVGVARTIFETNFVVDSVFSNRLSSDFYEKQSKYYDKLNLLNNSEDKGSDAYKKAKGQLRTFQCKYGYDNMTFKEMLSYVDNNKDMSKEDRYNLKRELKRLENQLMTDAINGKNSKVDVQGIAIEKFGLDTAIRNFTYTSTNDQGKENNHILKGYLKLKKNGQLNAKEYKQWYADLRATNRATGEHANNCDWNTIAMVTATSGKSDDYNKAYGVPEYVRQRTDNYLDSGGSMAKYKKTHGAVVAASKKLGYDYTNEMDYAEKALSLAKEGFKDRAYYIEGVENKTNPARCVVTGYGWTDLKLQKWANKHGISAEGASKGYVTEQEVIDAIAKSGAKTKQERAALFALYFPTAQNPYGDYGDWSLDGDTGSFGGGGHGYGRRGYGGGRGGWGYGGGSGAAAQQDWFKYVKDMFVASGDGYKPAKGKTYKSALDEAYRRRQRKLMG